jgi:hypothetical protein
MGGKHENVSERYKLGPGKKFISLRINISNYSMALFTQYCLGDNIRRMRWGRGM